MYKKAFVVSLSVLLVLVCVVVISVFNQSNSHAQQPSATVAQTENIGPESPGLSAISPQKITTDPSVPAFTTSDVENYVTTHPVPGALPSSSKPTIVKIAFLASQKVSILMKGESTGVPDGTLLCYVELRGTFTFSGPSSETVTYHTGVEVFDAHTGNLLIIGGQ